MNTTPRQCTNAANKRQCLRTPLGSDRVSELLPSSKLGPQDLPPCVDAKPGEGGVGLQGPTEGWLCGPAKTLGHVGVNSEEASPAP
eukprot:16446811-Heterocapsa_arctica.AAC.1